jgi:hypothetical protein
LKVLDREGVGQDKKAAPVSKPKRQQEFSFSRLKIKDPDTPECLHWVRWLKRVFHQSD